MRYTIISAIFICLLFVGCKKDKYTSAPQLEYKSVNTTVLDKFQVLSFKLEFRDLEGDLDSIYIEKVTPNCPGSNFKDSTYLPEFPSTKKQKGELIISYGYRVDGYPLIQEPSCSTNDTCYFRFVLRDKADHISDTINSEKIVILK